MDWGCKIAPTLAAPHRGSEDHPRCMAPPLPYTQTKTHTHTIISQVLTFRFSLKSSSLANPHLHCRSSHQSKSLCLRSSQGINTTLDISSLLESEKNRDSKPNFPKNLAKIISQQSRLCFFNSALPCWRHVTAKQQPAKYACSQLTNVSEMP